LRASARSELGIAERWFCDTALEDLLGVQAKQINEDRLYRGLDVLQRHKDRLCSHLLERYQSWFGVGFEFLLYDVTSTFFEGEALRNKRQRAATAETVEPTVSKFVLD
jgi:hypothetical protein